jgi:hypothetical protein
MSSCRAKALILNQGFSCDKCKLGGLHERHAVATRNLGKNHSICLDPEREQAALCRDVQFRIFEILIDFWLAVGTKRKPPAFSLVCVLVLH